MKDRILSFNEVDNFNRNIRMIENNLGHSVPSYLLNGEELSDRVLSFDEVDNVARNIRMIEAQSGRGGYEPRRFNVIDYFYLIVGTPIAIYILAQFFMNFKW